MTVTGFIATIWSARLLENLQKSFVYGQPNVINRDYEGEIKGKGSTLKITSIGDITIGDYTKDTDISDPEALDDAQSVLSITQAKYFNFAVDDVDKAQTSPALMNGAMQQSAYGLVDVADQFIAAQMYANVATANKIGSNATAIVPTTTPDLGTMAYDYLLQLGTKLSEANVPKQGRWVVCPPWFIERLASDKRFSDASASGSTDALLNGLVKRAGGFDVLESNNAPTNAGTGGEAAKTQTQVIAGSSIATTFADSTNQVEGYRPEKRFADAVKGLHVYGCKITRPDALALLTCRKVA
jgi:N4-gp56 family major capsid protein